MRFHAKSALFCLLLCLAAVPAVAEEESQKAIRSRPLTAGEGLAIVSAALDSHHHARVLSSSIRTVSTREPTTDDAVVDAPDEPSNDTASTARPANGQPVNFSTPRVTVVNAVRPKPDQVGAAFLQTCADSEASLRGRDF